MCRDRWNILIGVRIWQFYRSINLPEQRRWVSRHFSYQRSAYIHVESGHLGPQALSASIPYAVTAKLNGPRAVLRPKTGCCPILLSTHPGTAVGGARAWRWKLWLGTYLFIAKLHIFTWWQQRSDSSYHFQILWQWERHFYLYHVKFSAEFTQQNLRYMQSNSCNLLAK